MGGKNMVLDNLNDQVKPLGHTSLTMVSMSGSNPMDWNS